MKPRTATVQVLFAACAQRYFPADRPHVPTLLESGIEMAELRKRTEDEQASATATSTRPVTSMANATEGRSSELASR
ncbi:hypothetical protein BDN67DRAFT_976260, partial [Paxillus ammoniavirescens]